MRKWFQSSRAILARVPIYGELFNSPKDSLAAATKELSLATSFSLFPIWFYPLILRIGGVPFWETLKSFVVQGELYLYSAALLGPLVYATNKTYGRSDGDGRSDESDLDTQSFPRVWSLKFPYETAFSVISIVVCCSAAFLFGMLRTRMYDPLALGFDEEATLLTSAVLYAFTLSCMFCVLVYRLNLENIPDRFGEGERKLLEQWHDRD